MTTDGGDAWGNIAVTETKEAGAWDSSSPKKPETQSNDWNAVQPQ